MTHSTECAVVFPCEGRELVGVLHRPDVAASVGVVIVVGGPQYRVGSHRQFTQLARALADAGYAVLRFDYRGMGDSDGDARTFEDVQPDIAAAIGALAREVPTATRIVLWGLCDAVSAILLGAADDERVAALVLANPWVRSDAGEARARLKHYYLQRLLSPGFWRKLMHGGVNPAASIRGIAASWRKARGAPASSAEPTSAPRDAQPATVSADAAAATSSSGEFVERMLNGWQRYGGPVLLLLSGRDLTAREFEDLCGRARPWRRLIAKATTTVVRLPDADHTFSTRDALSSSTVACIDWLARVLPGTPRS